MADSWDSVSEAGHRCLPPSLSDWKAEQEVQESRAEEEDEEF